MRVLGWTRRAGWRCASTRRARSIPSRSRWSAPVGPGDAVLVHAGVAIARARARVVARVKFVDEFRDADARPGVAGEILVASSPAATTR